MKYAVVAPVAAGVTTDPAWMTAFARHVEACGFESIVVVEHTVLMTQYASVYPYDESGRVELAALGADRVVLAIPPITDLAEAADLLSACAQRLELAP